MITISNQQLEEFLDFPNLIEILKKAFQEDYTVPLRQHYEIENPNQKSSTLLLMPAWQVGSFIGIKLVTVSPENVQLELPSIQGAYLLFDAKTGTPLAQMDAKVLTNKRTAATSALASSFLSNSDSQCLLMLGTGSLAPYLIQAHASNRPIQKVLVWGRNLKKAQAIVNQFQNFPFQISIVTTIEDGMREADIISCATLSTDSLINGDWLKAGQHLDLVGSYKPNMREADDRCIQRSSIFIDTYEGAIKESGDLVIPIQNGTLEKSSIKADLFELCKQTHLGRQSNDEITFFKSVGHALEDLAAAVHVYQQITNSTNG